MGALILFGIVWKLWNSVDGKVELIRTDLITSTLNDRPLCSSVLPAIKFHINTKHLWLKKNWANIDISHGSED